MYVGVLHTITDPVLWKEGMEKFDRSALPEGVRNPMTIVGASSDHVFCLWDVPSVEVLQPMLDDLTKGASTNLYFAVDPEGLGTVGFPAARAAGHEPVAAT